MPYHEAGSLIWSHKNSHAIISMCSNVQVQHSLFTDVTETIALFAPSPDSSLMGKGKKYPTNPEGDL